MIRILVVDSPAGGGVMWWRNLRPLTEMAKTYPNLKIRFTTEKVTTLEELMNTDVVIMFRPVTSQSKSFLETCKRSVFNIKVILDIDDNLWRLPPGHPGELDYLQNENHLRQIYALADGIWCSTDTLMDFADARDGRGIVVPNAVLPRELPSKPSKYNGVVCWRGDAGQLADIVTDDTVEAFTANYERFKWLFWGYWPKPFRGGNCKGIPRTRDVAEYIDSLPTVGINMMWKPLEDNVFNDAKSNIAWIEATMAGAVCVTNYAGKPGWEWAIDHFTDNDDFIVSQWEASKAAILRYYNLEDVNEKRYQHILKVLGV